MRRVLVSTNLDGEEEITVDPDFMYFDTSAWIYILDSCENDRFNVIDDIAESIRDCSFRLLVSVINFFELITPSGDITRNFAPDRNKAFDYVHMISAQQPSIVSGQELARFLDKKSTDIYIFDQDHTALREMLAAQGSRKSGDLTSLIGKQQWWEEFKQRDRIMNLLADSYELSGIAQCPHSNLKARIAISTDPLDNLSYRKDELIKYKKRHKGKRYVSPQEETLLRYAGNKITKFIENRYGREEVAMLLSIPSFIFPGRKNLIKYVIADLKRGSELTFSELRTRLPGVYWQSKVTYYNYYYGHQKALSQSGDHNHAVYIPYTNYFGTCDRLFAEAIKTEYPIVYVRDKLQLFRIK